MPFHVVKVYINKGYTLYLSQEQDETQEEVKKYDPVISQTAPLNNLTLCLLLTVIRHLVKVLESFRHKQNNENFT